MTVSRRSVQRASDLGSVHLSLPRSGRGSRRSAGRTPNVPAVVRLLPRCCARADDRLCGRAELPSHRATGGSYRGASHGVSLEFAPSHAGHVPVAARDLRPGRLYPQLAVTSAETGRASSGTRRDGYGAVCCHVTPVKTAGKRWRPQYKERPAKGAQAAAMRAVKGRSTHEVHGDHLRFPNKRSQ